MGLPLNAPLAQRSEAVLQEIEMETGRAQTAEAVGVARRCGDAPTRRCGIRFDGTRVTQDEA
jgi:hypothetical protein